MKQTVVVVLAAGLLPMAALGQLEEVVVTGARVDFYQMPAVTVVKAADFLVQNVRLVNDSRSPDLRREEILGTIEAIIRRAEGMTGMALAYGTGFLEPIDLSDESLQLIEDRQRIDTSYVDVYAKVRFTAAGSAREQIAALRDFIAGAEVVGRTEILPLAGC